MYGVAAVHLAVGVLLAWIANVDALNFYHLRIEEAFWGGIAPAAARAQQVWWISLFGATVQSMSLWMWALVHIGNKQRVAAAWGWLIAGIVVWAPQDMWISMQVQVWLHVVVDLVALLVMLPPLVWLYRHDKRIAVSRETQRAQA